VVNGVVCISLPAPRSASNGSPYFGALGEFVAGPENRLAKVAVQAALADEPGYNPLVLTGPAGSGKSHLARGIAAEYARRQPTSPPLVASATEFAQEYGRARHARNLKPLRLRYRTSKLLVLEDLTGLCGKTEAQEELVLTIDELLDENRLVIVTCRQSPGAMMSLSPGLRSRLSAGLEVAMSLPGPKARLAILEKLAAARGTLLPKTVCRTLAEGLQTGVPGLIGAITALEASQRSEGLEIDAASARLYLATRQASKKVQVRPIATMTAKYFGIKLSELKGPSRQRPIVLARNVAMHLARQLTRDSQQQIGTFFGGRDHTTVLHGCRRVEELLKTDAETREAVQWLTNRLAQSC
jgi:chromosomal replication initiator protein